MRIIIEVSGGAVQSVWADDTDVSVSVLDHDTIENGTEEETHSMLQEEIKQLNEVY